MILVLAAVLGLFVHSDHGQQPPWLLGRLLRCLALPRVLESTGVESPIPDLGAYLVLE